MTQGTFRPDSFGRFIQVYHPVQMSRLDARTDYPASQIPADHVDEIAIATLYLLVMMILAVLIRLIFRLYMLRSLHWDDGIVVLSSVRSSFLSSVLFLLMSDETALRGRKTGLWNCSVLCNLWGNTTWLWKTTDRSSCKWYYSNRKGRSVFIHFHCIDWQSNIFLGPLCSRSALRSQPSPFKDFSTALFA